MKKVLQREPFKTRFANANSIDQINTSRHNYMTNVRASPKRSGQFYSALRRNRLRISYATQITSTRLKRILVSHHSTGHHGTCQAPQAHLIDANHET
jgi:hypothetical protein